MSKKLTLYDFQADVYINRTQNNIELLRKYADPVSMVIARNLEQDLDQFKKEMGLVSSQCGKARQQCSVTHTANPDGSATHYAHGMPAPSIANMGYVMKEAAREAAENARRQGSQQGSTLRVA